MNSEKQIAVYDNSVTARKYIGYIAESAGCFAYIGRDGKLYFRNIYQYETELSIDLFGEYKWGEEFKISKVSYEDGTRSFKFGDDTNNNLWIDQDNVFIVDEEQIEKIYNNVKGLTINSFEGSSVIDPAIDIGDKIIIDGNPIVYQGEMILQGKFVARFDSKIQIKQKEETTVKKESQKSINRKVKSEIDQIEGKITQLIQEQTSTGEKLSKVEQTVDGITQSVSEVEEKVEIVEEKADVAQEKADQVNNDLATKYYTKTETNSQIDQKADSITSTVSKTYSTKTETSTAKQEAINSANTSTDNKLKNYSTTTQMNSAINQKADEISTEVNKKVGEDELSTKIQQDYESVRIAWNKITEFIQFINAQLQIKDNSKKLLMALDKLGMHFYKSTGTELGDVGIQDTDVISFAVMNGQGSMAWGIKYTHDGATDFYPVFSFNGEMVADGSSENGGYGFDGHFDFEAPVRLFENPIYFTDENGANMQCDILGNLFLSALASITIYDNYGLDAFSMNLDNKSLNLFGLLNVGANVEGGYTFDFNGNSIMNAENMAWTDTIEYLSSGDNYLFVSNKDGTYFSLWTDSSDKNLKKNIKSTKSRALDKIKQIKHKEFNWKSNGEHQDIGYIAQEMQKIDPTFVRIAKYKTKDGKEKEDWQINTLSVLASVTKAMQEQDEEIENLKEKDRQKDTLIQSLLERIERLEDR